MLLAGEITDFAKVLIDAKSPDVTELEISVSS
jgi:hypothetical protein